jgi:two-component system, cell cycle sensor histidine kinase and response regulator CckA
MADWHPLLRRQIQRHLGGTDLVGRVVPLEFVQAIDSAYRRSDADLSMVERALALSSEELLEANARLRASHDDLERRVQERTKELESANEKLRHSQKMEAVGRLAGGVAHDFNNLLTVILGQSECFLDDLPADDPLREAAEDVFAAAERGAQLTRQLLAFSRRQVLTPREVDLNELVSTADRLLRRLIDASIELTLRLHDAPLWILADAGQIEQVIVNLVVNARDAMPDGGRLELRTSLQDGRAKLSVRDTGTGMTPEVLAHIFEPFFTTKGLGKGTGLGLATVYGIVEQSGGTIDVESTTGVGTCFTIALPIATRPEDTDKQAVAPAASGSETILVLEDEAAVRGLAARTLRRAGYHVLVAANGAEALTVCRDWTGQIDLALSDRMLPYMSGPEVVQTLRAKRPHLRVVFMSGYADESFTKGALFIQKPFRSAELLRIVRQALDGPAGEGFA